MPVLNGSAAGRVITRYKTYTSYNVLHLVIRIFVTVKDENVGWKHTCSGCSHTGFERIGSRSGYNPVQDIYILQRPSSCDPHFRYSEFNPGWHDANLRFRGNKAK